MKPACARPRPVVRSLIALGACAIGACTGAGRAVLAEASALHPLSVPAEPFLAAPTGGLPGPGEEAGKTEDGSKAGAATPGPETVAVAAPPASGTSPGRAGAPVTASATLPSMVPARGEARNEMVASTVRLLGIRESFEDRSFLGHVLRINDLLPEGVAAATYPAAEPYQRAKGGGQLNPLAGARPGDLLFYRCRSGCGIAAARDGVAAAVVESIDGAAVNVVAYADGTVQRCVAGAVKGAKGRVLEEVLGVADPWDLRARTGVSR